MDVKISIIIPCYNCQHNIQSLLDSICKNIPNYAEVILINDGSSDDTLLVIEEFINKHQVTSFKIITTENQGAAKSRELGLEKSIGEYIFFCDADDLISDDFFAFFEQHYNSSFDMIFFSSQILDVNSKTVISNKTLHSVDSTYYDPQKFILQQLQNNNWTSAVWTYIFKRENLISSMAHFTNRSAHEDHLFTLMLVLSSDSIFTSRKILYQQFLTPGSLTNSPKKPDYILHRLSAFYECLVWMGKVGVNNLLVVEYIKWSLHSVYNLFKVSKRSFFLMLFNFKNFPFFLRVGYSILSVLLNKR